MSTRPTFLQTPTIEIDQARYEELIRHELMYEQYRELADENTRVIIEANILNRAIKMSIEDGKGEN